MSYMNDSLRTDVFLRYMPETIACSCVYLSARILEIPLPPVWFEVFLINEDDIKNVCKIILKLYTRSKPNQDHLNDVIDKLKKEYERNRVSVLKQLESTNNETTTQSPTNQSVKKIRVEHVIQVPDIKKKQLIDSKSIKSIKDLSLKEEKSSKRMNERNGDNYISSRERSPSRRSSRSKSPSRRSSRSRSRDGSRKRHRDSLRKERYRDSTKYDKYDKYEKYEKYDKYDKYNRYNNRY